MEVGHSCPSPPKKNNSHLTNILTLIMRELFNFCTDACFVVMQRSMICGSNQKKKQRVS